MSKNSKTNQGLRARVVAVAAAVLLIGSTAAACGAGGGSKESAKDLRVLVEAADTQSSSRSRPLQGGDRHQGQARRAALRRAVRPALQRALVGSVSFDIAALDAIWLKGFADGVEPARRPVHRRGQGDLFPSLLTEAQVDGTLRRDAGLDELGDPLLPHGPVRRRGEQAGASRRSTATRSLPPNDLGAVPGRRRVLHPDTDGDGRSTCTAPTSRARSRPSGSRPCRRPARRRWCSTADGEVTIDSAEHLEALDFYTEPAALTRPPGRRAARLGRSAEPVQPGPGSR